MKKILLFIFIIHSSFTANMLWHDNFRNPSTLDSYALIRSALMYFQGAPPIATSGCPTNFGNYNQLIIDMKTYRTTSYSQPGTCSEINHTNQVFGAIKDTLTYWGCSILYKDFILTPVLTTTANMASFSVVLQLTSTSIFEVFLLVESTAPQVVVQSVGYEIIPIYGTTSQVPFDNCFRQAVQTFVAPNVKFRLGFRLGNVVMTNLMIMEASTTPTYLSNNFAPIFNFAPLKGEDRSTILDVVSYAQSAVPLTTVFPKAGSDYYSGHTYNSALRRIIGTKFDDNIICDSSSLCEVDGGPGKNILTCQQNCLMLKSEGENTYEMGLAGANMEIEEFKKGRDKVSLLNYEDFNSIDRLNITEPSPFEKEIRFYDKTILIKNYCNELSSSDFLFLEPYCPDICAVCNKKECQSCYNCSLCTKKGCQKCEPGFYLYNSRCVPSCPPKTFTNESALTCTDCKPGCLTCGSSLRCLTCENSFYYLYNEACVEICPRETYINDTVKACWDCPGNCSTCDRNLKCQECFAGFNLALGKCYQACSGFDIMTFEGCKSGPKKSEETSEEMIDFTYNLTKLNSSSVFSIYDNSTINLTSTCSGQKSDDRILLSLYSTILRLSGVNSYNKTSISPSGLLTIFGKSYFKPSCWSNIKQIVPLTNISLQKVVKLADLAILFDKNYSEQNLSAYSNWKLSRVSNLFFNTSNLYAIAELVYPDYQEKVNFTLSYGLVTEMINLNNSFTLKILDPRIKSNETMFKEFDLTTPNATTRELITKIFIYS